MVEQARRRNRYHKRTPWACDECRLRKRKCTGSQPCQPCSETGLTCSYDFRRGAQPPTQRIRSLEDHLRQARTVLKDVEKKLAGNDTAADVDIGAALKALDFSSSDIPTPNSTLPDDNDQSQPSLISMMGGSDHILGRGPFASTFYGSSSGFAFVHRTIQMFRSNPTKAIDPSQPLLNELFNGPLPEEGAVAVNESLHLPLPDWVTAVSLVDAMFANCHPLMNVLEERDFREVLNAVYSSPMSPVSEHQRFMPLLHLVFALGYLFSVHMHQQMTCAAAVKQATAHFFAWRRTFDVGQSSDLLSLQTVLCACLFLISTSRIVSAHAYIGVACSSAVRLGLHRDTVHKASGSSNQIRTRIRVFAAVLKLDVYSSLILGLPPFLQIQEMDSPVLSDLATNMMSSPSADGAANVHSAASLKHVELLQITFSSKDMIFSNLDNVENGLLVERKALEEAEGRLQAWMESIAPLLAKMGDRAEFATIKFELEMAYQFSQIVLFRPFLHYLCTMADGGSISLSESQYALACIKVASNTITRSELALKKGVLSPASWISIYNVFLSVMCLVFLISAHHGTSQPSEAWRKAAVGIEILAAHSCIDDGASACLRILRSVVEQLSHTVDFDFDSIEKKTKRVCQMEAGTMHDHNFSPSQFSHASQFDSAMQMEASTSSWTPAHLPLNFSTTMQSEADKALAQAEDLPLAFGFEDLLHSDLTL